MSLDMTIEGGQSYYRLSKADMDKEARNDRRRVFLQQQAQTMALFSRDEAYSEQTRKDAERYLNAIHLDCGDSPTVGKDCVAVHPSPAERLRRQKFLDDLNFQYGARWDQYYRQRDLTDFETQLLQSSGRTLDFLRNPDNRSEVLGLIGPRRDKIIKLIRQRSNETGILPGILIDDLTIEKTP